MSTPVRLLTQSGRSANLWHDPASTPALVADGILVGMGAPDFSDGEDLPPGSVVLQILVGVDDARVFASAMYRRAVVGLAPVAQAVEPEGGPTP